MAAPENAYEGSLKVVFVGRGQRHSNITAWIEGIGLSIEKRDGNAVSMSLFEALSSSNGSLAYFREPVVRMAQNRKGDCSKYWSGVREASKRLGTKGS